MSYIEALRRSDKKQGLELALHLVRGRGRQALLFNGPYLRRAAALHRRIEAEIDLPEDELRARLAQARELALRLRLHGDELETGLAALALRLHRSLGLLPYPVQLAAALAMHDGLICEMATGEGKSLTAALAAALLGWRGRGCHVLTSNSYLAGRDAAEFAPFYQACGLSVAALDDQTQGEARRTAYEADLTYCTNKDVAADFLRDQLRAGVGHSSSRDILRELGGRSPAGLTLRSLTCAVVDEADSVLIDDAVTPLLISMEAPGGGRRPGLAFARQLALALPRELWHLQHARPQLLPPGRDWLEASCRQLPAGIEDEWRHPRRRIELLEQALQAEHCFLLDREYVLAEGKVVIIDQATGRSTPDRFWQQGLHQAIEIKHGIAPSAPKETCARISFQRFFQLYGFLCGMTGTAAEASAELWRYYSLPVLKIPTHRPCLRRHAPLRCLASRQEKWQAVATAILARPYPAQPVLVGTASIAESEELGAVLRQAGLAPCVLNARNHAQEAEIIGRAGQPGAITVSTSMAGRGTDIKLAPAAKAAGGLLVIACQIYDSPRIDRQLYGRCSRQGDPGQVLRFASRDDKLLADSCPRLAGLCPLPVLPALLTAAQRLAVSRGRQGRQAVLDGDDWLQQMLGFSGESFS